MQGRAIDPWSRERESSVLEFVDVLIVGAGPVGMTLAMDLSRRGLKPLLIETRDQDAPPSLKCNHISARTMEAFRLLGIVADVRNAGLPEEYPHDVAFRTSFLGSEFTRIPIPCRRDRYSAAEGPDCNWPTSEPPHRLNQSYLEPILAHHLTNTFAVQSRYGTTFRHLVQDEDGVTVTLHDGTRGDHQVRCRYLIGCDGPRSLVREQIGARLRGDAVVLRVQSSYIRAPELLPALLNKGLKPAWGTLSLNPRRSGTVYAINGKDRWLVFNYLRDDEPDFESVDRDWAIRQILGLTEDFAYQLVSKQDWVGRRLIAGHFRKERVFICGDAAHIWVPFAGYGMNAGIADAMNLSWLLWAHLSGWAPAAILDAYEAERYPITEQVSHFAMKHSSSVAGHRKAIPAEIEDDDEVGERARADLGRSVYELNVQQYCCTGLNFGYFYSKSPIIAHDGKEAAPQYSMGDYTPSTVPGCRTPHFWLQDGRSLYDVFGLGYTLLRFDRNIDVDALVSAAQARSVPLTVLDLDVEKDRVADLYRHKLVLSRPDQHVAWRGDDLPRDLTNLVELIRGAGPRSEQRA